MVGRSSGCLCCRWAVNIPVWPSTPRPPAGPPSITEAECVTVCEAVEWAPAGWGAWLGPTDNRTFQNRVISYRGEGAWEPTAAFSASQIPSEREDAQYDLRGARSYPTLEDEGEQAAGRRGA